MKISDLLKQEIMLLDLKAQSKEAAIDEMISSLVTHGYVTDHEQFKEAILKREAQTSTGLGDGIAMPHAKNETVTEPVVLFARSLNGLDYEALDQQPTDLFFMIAVPANDQNDTHLQTLAAISRQLLDADKLAALRFAKTPQEITAVLTQEEAKETAPKSTAAETQPLIVAVTACPTGIAHTFMAEEALIKKAKEMNVRIRVETNGSDGVQHRLTDSEIAEAKGVIVAADTNVEMARFDGKPLLSRPVGDGIRQPEALINQILDEQAPTYHAKDKKNTGDENRSINTSVGSQIYKHLMNGVSNMLPFVIGGGIAIALAFMVDQFMGVPQSELNQLGSYNAFAGYLNTIGGAAFSFMLPILAGYIAFSIADRPGLVAGFVAGSLAASGGAGFLGALIGGFLAGYVMVFLKKALANLPKSLEGIRTILFYPVLGVLITGGLMLLINIPMQAINNGLNNFLNGLSGANAALLGALLAGMMAIDLGGPVNKAAYVFGTGTLAASVATGGSSVMAAVMAGGMVPPLAIFLATTLFKNKFDKQQQNAGLTNLIMGASFITEGAIPFAAADPLRIIPGFVAGSAVTGALVSGMGIKLMAPHGGIFVIFLISHPLLYIAFILLGALISALIIGFMKK
ncbi:PTS fructose transporter subunit IIABC [Vagococcus lutrae]|uniref:PTS fructose transporter subunit IIABC n=1 Tax=Vagococcus lutrae TaxID=81947 RepID=UPI00288D31A0|nr:fructose-specific PTS transporter subunit EIIC [Vagococcus lutrae]MDT2808413.1 fructose-specific PTS transporter subunit EIIC [Vagococcus lutrae]